MKIIKTFENYMSREEMCSMLCRNGHSMSDLVNCSNAELSMMCREMEDQMMPHSEKKNNDWIKETKMKKGALHRQLGYDMDEKIPDGILKRIVDGEVGTKIKVKGEEKTITALMKKRANLAKTLKSLKEHQETQNYMFFSNLETIKRLVDELLEMDEEMLDHILSEHDWASDHISVAAENIEHVFNFFATHEDPHHHNHKMDHNMSDEDDEIEDGDLEPDGNRMKEEIQKESLRRFRNFR